jgi:hypothetical protein
VYVDASIPEVRPAKAQVPSGQVEREFEEDWSDFCSTAQKGRARKPTLRVHVMVQCDGFQEFE